MIRQLVAHKPVVELITNLRSPGTNLLSLIAVNIEIKMLEFLNVTKSGNAVTV